MTSARRRNPRKFTHDHRRRLDRAVALYLIDEYVELSHRIDAERSAAKSIVEGIRRHLPLLPAVIPDSWRTMAVVQGLCVLADEYLTTSPERSVTVARVATTIADNLDVGYPRVLRDSTAAAAWTALGAALRASGLPFQALSAFDKAQDAVEFALHFSDDTALIELGRARALVDLRQFAEATEVVVRARELFASYEGVFESRITECDELLRIIGALCSRRMSLGRWAAIARRLRITGA